MANTHRVDRNASERQHALLLACAMAVVGGLFLFDKLGGLLRTIIFSFQTVLHSSPALIAFGAICVALLLYWAATAGASTRHPEEGQHEL